MLKMRVIVHSRIRPSEERTCKSSGDEDRECFLDLDASIGSFDPDMANCEGKYDLSAEAGEKGGYLLSPSQLADFMRNPNG